MALLINAIHSPPAIVLVEGEAGVGKSRLVSEAAAAAGARGQGAIVGRCHPLRESFLLGPVVEALRGGRQFLGGPPLSPVAGALRLLLPELADLLPPTPAPLGDPTTERHLLFRALAEVLHTGPSLCVLEDLHWADEGTLDFLRFFVTQLPAHMTLVLTYRTEQVRPDWPLLAITGRRIPGVAVLKAEIPTLTATEVRLLIGAILATPEVSDEFSSYVHDRTAGLPFAVEEVVRLAQDRNDIIHRDGRWIRKTLETLAVPPAVRDSVLERVRLLPADARRIAEAAAVAAEPAEREFLAKLAGLPRARATAALCSALGAAVLVDIGDRHYGLRHALATQAIYDAMLRPQRQTLHLRAAQLMEAHEPTPLAAVAHHYKAAGDVAGWLRYGEAAADEAAAAYDDATAARLLKSLLATEAARPVRYRLALKLGRVLARGITHDNEGLVLLRGVLDDDHLPAVVRGDIRSFLGTLIDLAGDASGGRRELVGSLADLPSDSTSAVRAMTYLAYPGVVEGTAAEHLEFARLASETAARQHDEIGAFEARVATVVVSMYLGDPAAWQLEAQLPTEVASVEQKRALLLGYMCLQAATFHLGNHNASDGFLQRARRLSEELRAESNWAGLFETADLLSRWAGGHWEGLEERAARHLEAVEFCRGLVAARRVLACLALARGDLKLAEQRYEQFGQAARKAGVVVGLAGADGGLGRVLLAKGEPEAALAATSRGLQVLARKGIWVWGAEVVPVAVEAAIATGRVSSARRLMAAFGRAITGRDAPLAAAALEGCRGLMADAEGRGAAAAAHFVRAQAQFEALPRPYEAARMAERRGVCLLALGEPGGSDPMLEALACFDALGATWDAARARRSLRAHSVALPQPWRGGRRGYGDSLSPRERDVAEMVAQGRTNTEIAHILFLSSRTVEKHVASALRKLAVPSRTALARRWLTEFAVSAKDG